MPREADHLVDVCLNLITATVDRDLRCHRPSRVTIFERVRRRCYRAGWALNRQEEREVTLVVRA
jgi:hypothetical protein